MHQCVVYSVHSCLRILSLKIFDFAFRIRKLNSVDSANPLEQVAEQMSQLQRAKRKIVYFRINYRISCVVTVMSKFLISTRLNGSPGAGLAMGWSNAGGGLVIGATGGGG
jgi:hypothetical protein